MKSNTAAAWACMAVLLGAGACAGDGSGGAAGSGGRSASERASGPGPVAIQSFSPETQAFMKEGLHQFSKGDPKWSSTRATWLAMGPTEADFLVQAMWAALLRFQALDEPKRVEQARHELALIGAPAVPLLAEFLKGGTFAMTDEIGERQDVSVDDLARRDAAETLGLIGAPAVGAVRSALEGAESKSGKRYALETLGFIGDRGGAAAYEPLLAYARSDDESLRVTAVFAMRFFHDGTTRSALLRVLDGDDELVRRKAAEALMNRRDASAVPAIRAAAGRARSEGKLADAAEMERQAAWILSHPK